MTELDVEIVLQRAKEEYPYAHPRIISDNGPQFVTKEFKQYIRISGMPPVQTPGVATCRPRATATLLLAASAKRIPENCL